MEQQISLFSQGLTTPYRPNCTRRWLDKHSWVEHVSGWFQGHEALFNALLEGADWSAGTRVMFQREVAVPRQWAVLTSSRSQVLASLRQTLSERYQRALTDMTCNLYRTGADSVAWHGDRLGELRRDTVVAIVSLGSPRKFLLKPARGGRSLGYALGWGDLLVMGGRCQADWLHCVPKVKNAGPRISVMFRERAAPSEPLDPRST